MAKLSFINYNRTHLTEWENEDVDIIEILDSLVGLLVAATFPYKSIVKAMYEFCIDHLDPKDREELENL